MDETREDTSRWKGNSPEIAAHFWLVPVHNYTSWCQSKKILHIPLTLQG